MKVELYATVEHVGREDNGAKTTYAATMTCASRGPEVTPGSVMRIDGLNAETARALGAAFGRGGVVWVTIEVDKT